MHCYQFVYLLFTIIFRTLINKAKNLYSFYFCSAKLKNKL